MDKTRRTVMGVGAGLMLASATSRVIAASHTSSNKPNSPGVGRIDVHQHLLPPEFLATLERHGLSAQWAPVKWSVEGALAMMDEQKIATGILSLSAPGPHFGNDAEARMLSRQINERQAALVQGRPGRFGMFACVPLPDVDGALKEIAYAYDTLSTDGVVLLANTNGIYLGDPAFDPILEELNRRRAVVLIHPNALAGPPAKKVRPSAVDFLLDTTRAALSLVFHESTRRFPNIRMILSHAGGFIPYAAYRIAQQSNVADPDAMLDQLSNFYFDTALSASPTVLPSLLPFAKPGHVLFGSDSPYASNKNVEFFANHLDNYAGLNAEGYAAINRKNAEALFPRLAMGQGK